MKTLMLFLIFLALLGIGQVLIDMDNSLTATLGPHAHVDGAK